MDNSMDRKIIIPSAILVPEELQNLGKLPAIIYPVNQKIVFNYLYEQYKDKSSSINIICCIGADKVCRRLSKYIGKGVVIEELPELKDLGHTIQYGIRNADAPIVINFADTIVADDILFSKGDAYFYSEDFLSDTWTYFEEENGIITSVYDKVDVKSEEKKKLFVGVFQILNTPYFRKCLEEAFDREGHQESNFYYALRLYSQKHPMEPIKTDNWFDIGHADKYCNSKLEVRAREFNHITIDRDRGILKKTSDNKEKFIGEIKWYLKLPTDIEYVRPRIFDYSTDYSSPYVSMEYYSYYTLHELFLYGDLNRHQWSDIFSRIRFVCNDFKRYYVDDLNIKPALEEMYLTKTLLRFDKLRADKSFASFFSSPITVNGERYQSLDSICGLLKERIPGLLYDVDRFNIIHGDLCFANIMVDDNFSFIKVIDPRGRFGAYDIYGDFRYELAKLFHSVDGKYDFIIKDLFEIEYDFSAAIIEYSIQDRKRDYDLFQLFIEVFKDEIGNGLKEIELIEALLFLSMIPLHGESMNHQMAMLATGIELLNRVIDIKES